MQLVVQHGFLFAVHLQITLQLNLFEIKLFGLDFQAFLRRLDLTFKGLLLLLAGFGVELDQNLPRFNLLAFLHQDVLNNTTDGHLDVLNRSNRFELSWGNNNLLSSGKSQPSHTEHGGSNQGPGDGAHPETTLLEHGFVVFGQRHGLAADVLDIRAISHSSGGALERIQSHDQASPCWR